MGTMIVAAAVLALMSLAVRSLYRDKKAGKGCNGNCGGCKSCH